MRVKKGTGNDVVTAVVILVVTVLTLYLLPLIPGFLRQPTSESIVGFQPNYLLVFLSFDIIMIGIPAWIHWRYVHDYTSIKSVQFFALFGSIVGRFFWEASLIKLLPNTILMLIYALFYTRFTWWKVALTVYLFGIIVENVINRSPIQLPTLTWIAFFHLSLLLHINI